MFVYPALGSSTGTLDDAPIATISGSNTGLSTHTASRWIPAATSMWRTSGAAERVCLSGAGKQHRDAQRGPHRHHQREQHRPDGYPYGIALDSSGNIYVADRRRRQRVCLSGAGKQRPGCSTRPPPPPSAVRSQNWVSLCSSPSSRLRADTDARPRRATATATPTATATATQTVHGNAADAPRPTTTLSAAPAKLNFGSVDATGTSKPKKVALTNKGTTAAVIGSVTATPPFVVAGGENTCSGQTIEPKKKCSFDVEFAPATPGAVSDQTIEVGYNGASPAMSLSGTGIAVTLKAPKESFCRRCGARPARQRISRSRILRP